MPADPKKKKKNSVLSDGFFMDEGRKFELNKEFSDINEAKKLVKKIRDEGFLADLSSYSPNKHKKPFKVYKGPKKKVRTGGYRGGSRKPVDPIKKKRIELKVLTKEYLELPPKSKEAKEVAYKIDVVKASIRHEKIGVELKRKEKEIRKKFEKEKKPPLQSKASEHRDTVRKERKEKAKPESQRAEEKERAKRRAILTRSYLDIEKEKK